MTDSSKHLARLCRRALAGIPPDKRLPNYRDLLDHRLKQELRRIREWKLASFLLFVHEINRYLRENGIPFSGGLGAESSSLAAHLLGLAPLEPVRNGFIFERLLSENDPAVRTAGLQLIRQHVKKNKRTKDWLDDLSAKLDAGTE